MNSQPLVSILIPAFKPRYFAECLQSALDQTYQNIEILIGDDSGGDEIAGILAAIPAKPVPVRYMKNAWQNEGNGRRNHINLLNEARGEFIKFLNDDDVLQPRCVEQLLSAFERYPNTTLAVSRRTLIDEDGETLPDEIYSSPPTDGDFVIEGKSLAKALLETFINFVGEPSTALFRKRHVQDNFPDLFSFGGRKVRGIGDFALWLGLCLKGDAVYFGEPLSKLRLHAEQRIHSPGLRELATESMTHMRATWAAEYLDASDCPPGQLYIKDFPPENDEKWRLLDIAKYEVRHRFPQSADSIPKPVDPRRQEDRQEYDQAKALLAKGDTEAAFGILRRLAESGSQCWEVYNDLGALALTQGDMESAKMLLELATDLEESPGPARLHLAQFQALTEQFEPALATLSPLLRAEPNHTEAIPLVRDLLGAAPTLSPIAWARLLADLRTPTPELRTRLDREEETRRQLIESSRQNRELREQVAWLRDELRHRSASSDSTGSNTWEAIHALPDDEWLSILIRSVEYPWFHGFPLPTFPSDGLQVGTVGSSNESALREGFNFYRTVKEVCNQHGLRFSPDMRLLDFGTGWGRYARIFMKDFRPENIVGVDVDASFIGVCRDTFPYCNFETVPPFPPTELPAGQFNLIVAYSVFSHLSEAAATAWIQEFSRVLAPGGMIAITTQGRSFLDYCETIRETGSHDHPWHQNLARSFVDVRASQAAYDRGEFLFSATGGGDARPSTFYGEALVPEGFVREKWAVWLEPVAFIDDRQCLPQALIVMRKRP